MGGASVEGSCIVQGRSGRDSETRRTGRRRFWQRIGAGVADSCIARRRGGGTRCPCGLATGVIKKCASNTSLRCPAVYPQERIRGADRKNLRTVRTNINRSEKPPDIPTMLPNIPHSRIYRKPTGSEIPVIHRPKVRYRTLISCQS